LEGGSLEEAAQRVIKAIADRELDAICHEILNDVQEGQSFNISHNIDPSWLSCAAYVDAEGSLVRFDIKAVARARLNGVRMMDPPKYARAFSVDAARFTELWPATDPASPSATANEDMRQVFVELEAPSPVASVVSEAAIEEEADTSPTKPQRKLKKGCWALAQPKAFKWLEDNGTPAELGDKAKLEKHIRDFLGTRKEYRASSTIRAHVTGWIKEFEAGSGS
jgi:hypothetical protein